MIKNDDYILITGSANVNLARAIASKLMKQVYEPVTQFSDGEIHVQIPVSLRDKNLFIIQPTTPNVNDHLMELFLMVDAAKRASVKKITAVIPYFGYARQDRKDKPRVPISSSAVSKIMEFLGVNKIVTIDIHSDQQQGFVSIPWDNLYGSYAILPVIKKLKIKNLVVVSPDKGGTARANAYAKRLNADGIAIVFKERDTKIKNVSTAMDVIGEVKNKNLLIVDDMLDTAGTLTNAAELLKSKGAKDIYVATTHGLFSGPALERIMSSSIKEVYVTDTIPLRKDVLSCKKVKVVSVASFMAEAIKHIDSNTSLSENLID